MVLAPVSASATRLGRILVLVSVALLAHAMLSTVQFRHFVRAAGEESPLPIDVSRRHDHAHAVTIITVTKC